MSPKETLAALFVSGMLLVSLAACSLNSIRLHGKIGGEHGAQGIGGVAGVHIYAFRADQLLELLRKASVHGKRPDARLFFDNLPYSLAVAHTTSGPYSGHFDLSLPKTGTFVIAARTGEYPCARDGKQGYWLVPVSSTDLPKGTLELDNSNFVDSDAAGQFQLDMTHCYTRLPGQ